MTKLTCLLACVVAVCISKVHADFEPDVRAAILERVTPIVKRCAENNGVTYDEIRAAQAVRREVEDLPACFLGCMARETGVISSDGVYNTDNALDLLEDLVVEEFPLYKKRARQCGCVNNRTYCDGTRGCEIAKAVFICYRRVDVEIVLTDLPPSER